MCITFSPISSANFSETVYIVLVRSCTEIQFSSAERFCCVLPPISTRLRKY